MPDKQLSLQFDASERESERLAAMPKRRYARRDLIIRAAIADGFDDKGKRVSAGTLRLVLLAINSFGDECYAGPTPA